jgi:hypothetical protein
LREKTESGKAGKREEEPLPLPLKMAALPLGSSHAERTFCRGALGG